MDASQASHGSGSQARSSSGSVRPHASRSTNPDKQISQIEKSVTHLLVATKQLLETLTQWSRGNAQEEEVSDVYVRLGYEFNLACRAFNSIGVETNDLGPVPDLLRSILEDTLSQPASPQALDNYLPRIRDIIINLLHGLKRKQGKLRSRPAKDGSSKPPGPGVPPRQTSVTSVQSNETGLDTTLDNTPGQLASRSDSKQEALRFTDEPQNLASEQPRTTSINRSSFSRPSHRNQSRQTASAEPPSNVPSTDTSNLPTISIPPEPDRSFPSHEIPFPFAPPPPPKQDALTALQRGPDLERRASRRFSAYQIQKHLGASPNGVPVIPPAQNSPIPNRGREARESLNAVRSRTSFQSKRSATRLQEISPSRDASSRAHNRISEERDDLPETNEKPSVAESANENLGSYSPTVKTPDEYLTPGAAQPVLSATVNGPMSLSSETYQNNVFSSTDETNKSTWEPVVRKEIARQTSYDVTAESRFTATPSPTAAANLDATPPQGKELTLFLQYKSKIKKYVLSDGFEGLTMARLQLAFIEKFAWNTHNNGVDLPEIYIQDPVSGVRHELEDLTDVKDRSVLVLNVEVLDEVKKHFDEGIGGLRTTLESVRSLLDGQGTMFQRFSDRQLETSKEMARLSTVPINRPSRSATLEMPPAGTPPSSSESSMTELQNLRRDIAVLRQTYATMSTDFAATMSDIKIKAAAVKEAAAVVAAPSYEGDAGRAHVNTGKKQLGSDSEALVNRVDDLTDVVEDLRKDVVSRGVRPLPRQLEEISKEITATNRQLNKVKEFMKREKPVWTKIWEKELDQVCTERDDLTQQEELVSDLDGDLQDLTGVFKLVEEAMKQQTLQATGPGGLRNTSKQFDIDPSLDPQAAKDGVLDEVRALKPNHESRLEAIERAEKARQRELQNRSEGQFQREVKEFVEEGRLKKTGGMDEVERLRKVRDERAMKENWERQQAREAEREKKRQAEAAAKAAAAAEATAKESVKEEEGVADAPHPENEALPTAETVSEATTQESHPGQFSSNTSFAGMFHNATTIPNEDQVDVGKSLSQQEQQTSIVGMGNGQESGPPHSSEHDNANSETDPKEEAKQTASTETKPNVKDNDWWKPAIF